ncbi:MAG: hypothetical protein MRJ65_17700 [Candidatus Brocadiaceae bacterium]|nr:hypothetical protein [Candidatus Brocadiaceae bacterium]
MTEKDPDILSLDEIERIEKLTLRWIFQAVLDFGMEASAFCYYSYTQSKDIFFLCTKKRSKIYAEGSPLPFSVLSLQ